MGIADHCNVISITANSQANPLKAVAEFVENSIDARAKQIIIMRGKKKGEFYLKISSRNKLRIPPMKDPDLEAHLNQFYGLLRSDDYITKKKLALLDPHKIFMKLLESAKIFYLDSPKYSTLRKHKPETPFLLLSAWRPCQTRFQPKTEDQKIWSEFNIDT